MFITQNTGKYHIFIFSSKTNAKMQHKTWQQCSDTWLGKLGYF